MVDLLTFMHRFGELASIEKDPGVVR